MNAPPSSMDNANVIAYSILGDQHTATGFTRHFKDGSLTGKPFGLAICRYPNDDGFYLFYCDSDWNTITDTWHETLDEAKLQAEREFTGVSTAWESV